jgi:tRNA 2-thiocytidine biosynthesis protein TtcA
MIEAGDKVMVCLSGGKDSHGLLDLLLTLRERAPIDSTSSPSTSTRSSPAFRRTCCPYLAGRGVPFHIETQDTYSIVTRLIEPRQDDVFAVLAAAARHPVPRGRRTRCDQDRARATIATTSSAPSSSTCSTAAGSRRCRPSWSADDGKHVVIRPLAYVKEPTSRATRR